MDLQRKLGRRIRELRLRRRMTQGALGRRCGDRYPAQRIGEIERGNMNVTLATLEALSKGLGCEPLELFLFNEGRADRPPKLPNRRLADLWAKANDATKSKLLRVLHELL